eukprot:7384988-Lingulodinium_polyedra.AAC.1
MASAGVGRAGGAEVESPWEWAGSARGFAVAAMIEASPAFFGPPDRGGAAVMLAEMLPDVAGRFGVEPAEQAVAG